MIFFEFFMLFFAVFCGFMAEYMLEYQLEREQEKEFMVSMVEELQADSVQVNFILRDSTRVHTLDTLSLLILGGDRSFGNMLKIYQLYYGHAGVVVGMEFNRNTLTQLKNAGNMRLIRNLDVVDSLNMLDNMIRELDDQMDSYREITMENFRLGAKTFDLSYMVRNGRWMSQEEFNQHVKTLTFLTNDRASVIELGNSIQFQSSILKYYHLMLNQYRGYSNRLIRYLQKEYDLKD